ncbi:MAG TPA: 2-oxoglutarate oxidoreductase [Hungateiclostridium thermocellum]|jgi:2-oxoglutarate ferredoxin oxidoreductase subunit beta|uniref:Thiamine pyrophosphate TPP-binding domain-containing protein n=2 Tax=Acetivibrio thermocellus TaxID=1515 RepID=A3DDS0_ACET2|nr:thiamine pyrophosphate-dependent enzyme [Acetivibrio thermocellus]CDG35557.1 Ketoisovalerate oxidoreductase subunit VorA [Acetivibrio thermocellus BC1]ABN52099.1 thiamine pyrophosphate TPP-binding domain-containing protein [Acetivibrio thermocellus ATCC 27405]ADU74418.1 thiamine pyrophosphate TPP-binding domain-containing protein [Acetivibrio thermocellus DSM 1313]ALX08361.1 2-oxoglutarate synthase [Acetivibrio thermocellus AD2]ANV76110.1 2-oxoglutarate synthase [Acetivibrio thermocellus DS
MNAVFKKPHALVDVSMHYCPGCTHGIVHRLIAEVIDELDIEGKTIGVSPVGCAYNNYEYFNCDMIQAAHGRAPAVATGAKRVNPDNVVFAYQGDGDLAAIGTAEIVHAATRGEKITVIFINNAIYGMTSGQMAPTTLIDQVTTTTPFGRKPEVHGYPINVCELLSTLEGAVYVERVSVHDIKNIMNAKKAIKKAFKVQMANLGFSIVEVLSSCPTNWGLSPVEALKWIEEKMIPVYPLGNYKGKDLEV